MATKETILELQQIIYTSLHESKEIKLIYCSIVENSLEVSIVCNTNNITLINLSKIIETMNKIKKVIKDNSMMFGYLIITEENLDENINLKNPATIEKLTNCDILYCEDDEYIKKINDLKKHKVKIK